MGFNGIAEEMCSLVLAKSQLKSAILFGLSGLGNSNACLGVSVLLGNINVLCRTTLWYSVTAAEI